MVANRQPNPVKKGLLIMKPVQFNENTKRQTIQQVDLNLDHNELALIQECIENRWLSEGEKVKTFSELLSGITGAKYVTFAPNGTLGLYLALLALDLPKDSEIILPSFTFYGSATSCVFAGLKPVFVDVYDDTFNIDPTLIEAAITEKTKAIMAIHIYGQACDMKAIMSIAKKHNLYVVEDAAQSIGVKINNEHVGCHGDIGVFSFFSDKVMTTGEGAALTTNNESLFERIKLLRNQGRPNAGTFIHPELGMNFRITEIQAAIGMSQIKKLDSIIKRRLEIWDLYKENLFGVGDLKFMSIAPFSNLIPFRFLIRTQFKDALGQYLNQNEIATRSSFYPMHLQPKLAQYKTQDCPVSETLYQEGSCLPVHAHISDDDVLYICNKIKDFFHSI